MSSVQSEFDLISQQLTDLTSTLIDAPVPSRQQNDSLALAKLDEDLALQHVKEVEKMLQRQLKPPRSLSRPKAIQVAKKVLKSAGLQMLEVGAGVVLVTAGSALAGPAMIVPLTMGILMIVDGMTHIAHVTWEELMAEAHDVITDPLILQALTHNKEQHKPPKSLHSLEGAAYWLK